MAINKKLKQGSDVIHYETNEGQVIGISSASTSEKLTNTDKLFFKAGTGVVNSATKDYSSKMMSSLITLNDIEGKTIKENNSLMTRKIRNIYTLDEKDTKNYFDNVTLIATSDSTTHTLTGTTLRIQSTASGWQSVRYRINNLDSDYVYAISCDNVTVVKGGSCISAERSQENIAYNTFYKHSASPGVSSQHLLVRPTRTCIELYFYANLDTSATGGDVTYTNITIRKVKNIVSPDVNFQNFTLGSLPNGVCDRIKDNILYSNLLVTSLNGSEHDWVHWKTENNIAVYYTRPGGVKPTADNVNTGILCDKFPSLTYNETVNPTKEGVSLYSGYNYIGVCISSSKASNLEKFRAYLQSNPITVITEYYDDWKTLTPINPTILAEKGDVIYIDTHVPITCTHQVSLNTKSQIEEVQKAVDFNIKSLFDFRVWINSFKVSMYSNGNNGYIRFPSALGGLLIQWGNVSNVPSNTITRVNFPIAFTSSIKYIGGGMVGEWYSDGGTTGSSNGVVCNGRDFTYFNIGHRFGPARSLNWLAIGF